MSHQAIADATTNAVLNNMSDEAEFISSPAEKVLGGLLKSTTSNPRRDSQQG